MSNEWDQQRRVTAGTIEAHSDMSEEVRRDLANTYALQQGVIEEGEDLINDYHHAGVHDLRSVQSFVDGDKKNWEEAREAIDDVSGWNPSRRGLLAGIASALGVGAIGGYALSDNSGATPQLRYSEVDASEFENFYQSLRESQKRGIGLIYGDEEELFGDKGRDLVAFEAKDDGDVSTEPEYKAWVQFPGGEVDDFDWQEWNTDDYNQFAEQYGAVSEEERAGEDGYINSILEGEYNE